MAPTTKRQKTLGDLFLGPRGTRLFHYTSNEEKPEEICTTSPNRKPLSFVFPKLDESQLIIEEIGMGSANGPKAQLGSKVSVKCIYESDAGQKLQTVKCDFVLGNSEVMVGLHDGIVGMRPWDKRKITIPSSMRHEGRAVCEVTLVKIH